jgi:hypothetical protein
MLAAAAMIGLVLLASHGVASASEPHRLCGIEVELSDIPAHLDVEINGVEYHRPGTGPWSVVFDDADGVFTARYFNESGDWGTVSYDVGPAQDCETTTTPSTGPATTSATTTPSTDPATTRARSSTLPATGPGPSVPALALGSALALVGALLVLATRLRVTRE